MLNSLTTIVDFIWILSIGYIWTHSYKNNPVWNSLNGIHVFTICCSVLNMLLKVPPSLTLGRHHGPGRSRPQEPEEQQQQPVYLPVTYDI